MPVPVAIVTAGSMLSLQWVQISSLLSQKQVYNTSSVISLEYGSADSDIDKPQAPVFAK